MCVCVICAGRGFIFGNSLEYKEDFALSSRQCLVFGLLGYMFPTHRSWPGLNRDNRRVTLHDRPMEEVMRESKTIVINKDKNKSIIK